MCSNIYINKTGIEFYIIKQSQNLIRMNHYTILLLFTILFIFQLYWYYYLLLLLPITITVSFYNCGCDNLRLFHYENLRDLDSRNKTLCAVC